MAISILSRQPESFGSQSGAVGQLQLDSSYPTGGYSVTPAMLALSQINSFTTTSVQGAILIYNYTTQKLMAFSAGGGGGGTTSASSGGTPSGGVNLSPVTNEIVAIAANVGNTSFQPFLVQNVYVTVGGATGAFTIVPGGTAPAVGEVSVSETAPILTFNAADAVVTASVTYSNRGGSFSGSALAPHTHTYGGGGGGGLTEVSGGTNLSSVYGNYIVIGD